MISFYFIKKGLTKQNYCFLKTRFCVKVTRFFFGKTSVFIFLMCLMNFKIIDSEFIAGYDDLSALPKDLSHVIILGRANSGKSTLVNKLCQRKKLAKTSKTPGRTQEFNFFKITYEVEDNVDNDNDIKKNLIRKSFYFVDLPGFGFSKFSKEKRSALSKNIVDYINSDFPISSILLLNDSRRTPQADEKAIQNLCFKNSRILQIILTKVDKLKKNDIKKQQKLISQCYNLESSDVLLSGENISFDTIWRQIINNVQNDA